jgi:hypothetical protein
VKTALAWPFLISRGRDTGYRTIVAPDFLCNLGRRGLLLEVAGGDIREGDVATYRAILGQGTNVGDLSVVYRTIPARGTDIDIEGDLLRDRQGRRIALVEGVVLRGRQPAVDVRSGDLERTHHAVIAAFRSFWQNERSFDVVPSTPLEISNRPLDLRLEPPYVLSDPAEQPYRSEPSKIRPQQPATANNQTQTHESTSTSPTTENEAQLLLYIQRLENELHHLKSRKPEPTVEEHHRPQSALPWQHISPATRRFAAPWRNKYAAILVALIMALGLGLIVLATMPRTCQPPQDPPPNGALHHPPASLPFA